MNLGDFSLLTSLLVQYIHSDCDSLLLCRALQQSDRKLCVTTTKSAMCSLFQTLREPPVKRTDLQASTLVGPTRDQTP